MRSLIDLVLLEKRFRRFLAIGLALIATSALPRFAAQDLQIETLCDDRLSISWEAPPKAGGYQFTSVDGDGGKVTCSDSEPNCVIEGLKPGQAYSYFLDRVTSGGVVFGDPIQLKVANMGSCPEYIATSPTPPPPVDTCSHLPADIVVSGFRAFETQCRQVDSAGVGNAGLIAQGVLRAVDIWGNANAEIQVCFRQQGRLKFLDAATAPRAVSDLVAENIAGMTCGWINRAGTVALLQGSQAVTEIVAETSDSPPPPAPTGPSSTTICELVTSGRLSLRAGPSVYYARLLSMPSGARLVARARIDNWFMVNYEGQLGWASGEYLAVSPGCDSLGEAGAIILPSMIETPTPETEEAMTDTTDTKETVPETVATKPVVSVGQALAGCQLTAADILNLRAGPGLDYDIFAEIPYQSSLNAIAIAGDWFKVEYEGQAGWVIRDYVFRWGNCDAASAAASINLLPVAERVAVEAETLGATLLTGCSLRTADIINLRQGPGLEYGVIAEIPFQMNLNATARSGDWFAVEHEGVAGWVINDYVFRNGACG